MLPVHKWILFSREFLRRVSSSKLRETNPKCQVTSVVTSDYSNPTVDVTFSGCHKGRSYCYYVYYWLWGPLYN